jgi:hypothetical protein
VDDADHDTPLVARLVDGISSAFLTSQALIRVDQDAEFRTLATPHPNHVTRPLTAEQTSADAQLVDSRR